MTELTETLHYHRNGVWCEQRANRAACRPVSGEIEISKISTADNALFRQAVFGSRRSPDEVVSHRSERDGTLEIGDKGLDELSFVELT